MWRGGEFSLEISDRSDWYQMSSHAIKVGDMIGQYPAPNLCLRLFNAPTPPPEDEKFSLSEIVGASRMNLDRCRTYLYIGYGVAQFELCRSSRYSWFFFCICLNVRRPCDEFRDEAIHFVAWNISVLNHVRRSSILFSGSHTIGYDLTTTKSSVA